jgi:hypothetical protein
MSARTRTRIPTTCTATAMMATDAMRSLPFDDLCDVIEAHIEAMPHDQIDAGRLDRLANRLGRIAHMAARAENDLPDPSPMTGAGAGLPAPFLLERGGHTGAGGTPRTSSPGVAARAFFLLRRGGAT